MKRFRNSFLRFDWLEYLEKFYGQTLVMTSKIPSSHKSVRKVISSRHKQSLVFQTEVDLKKINYDARKCVNQVNLIIRRVSELSAINLMQLVRRFFFDIELAKYDLFPLPLISNFSVSVFLLWPDTRWLL